MNTTDKSRVMHMAHKLLTFYPTLSWSEIMKLAWQFLYLRQMLRRGIVMFSYYKVNDVILTRALRQARGTLCNELIPADKQPTGSPLYTPNYTTMSYYDLDAQGWRSFRLDCLHNIDRYIALNEVILNEEEE